MRYQCIMLANVCLAALQATLLAHSYTSQPTPQTPGNPALNNDRRSEVTLMMRTLRDMNMSKFVAEDVPLFLSLVDDLFPGQKAERSQFPEVMAALEKVGWPRGLGGGVAARGVRMVQNFPGGNCSARALGLPSNQAGTPA